MEKSNIVYRTNQYSMFKRLEGNRKIPKSRINKIIASIQKVGYVQSPVVVNEKMEVVDGQGRIEALKELGLPVDYIIVKGIGIEECRAMNINQENWKLIDHIHSYAETGNESYIFFENLIKLYKNIGIKVINQAITGLACFDGDKIKNGRFVCTKEDYENAQKVLDYESRFIAIVKKIQGQADYIYMAIGFCFYHKDIENERLFEKLSEKYDRLIPPANMEQALDELSKIYNDRLRGEKVYLSTDYKREMDKKYGWYEKRYGSKPRHYV